MKKILIYTLLLANLCSGLAFAWDTHTEMVMDHDVVAVNMVAGEVHNHSDSNLPHSDHCGHGAAHLTGIIYNSSTPVMTGSQNQYSFAALAFNSLHIAPLLRPPIS